MDMQTLAAAVALSKGGGGSFAPDITNPQDGDTLVYNAAQQKWVNGAGSSGFVVLEWADDEQHGGLAVNKTWKEIHDLVVAGTPVILHTTPVEDYPNAEYSFGFVYRVDYYEGSVEPYGFECDGMVFSCSTEDEYPRFYDE